MARGTRIGTRHLTRRSRKSNWGGWIRTTDLLINSRESAPGSERNGATDGAEITSVDDSRHTNRHTVRQHYIKPLRLGGGNVRVA